MTWHFEEVKLPRRHKSGLLARLLQRKHLAVSKDVVFPRQIGGVVLVEGHHQK